MTVGGQRDLGLSELQLEPECQTQLSQPEPFVVEMAPRLPHSGLALDVAAGSGRHSVLLGSLGLRVIAIDNSVAALKVLSATARGQRLQISAVAADLGCFPLPTAAFDLIINVNFLDRELVPRLKRALKTGGLLLFDTFLVDQAQLGRPRNPAYLLRHWELRELLADMDLLEYREGLARRHDGRSAWRASALAAKRS
jgi:tellurite methyltransferase